MPLVTPNNSEGITIAFEGDDTGVQKTVTDVQKSVGKLRASLRTASSASAQNVKEMTARMIDLRTSIRAAFATIPKVIAAPFKVGANIIKSFGALAGNIFKKTILGGMLLFALSLQKITQSIRESVAELINIRGGKLAQDVEEVKGKFTELRASVAAAFLPLIEAALPYINIILDALLQLFNRLAMITAAFVGQKEVLQVTAGSAAKLAAETKKTEKAARGALAAFDKIDVLTVPKTEDRTVEAEMVPITDDILTKVQQIKAEIAEWFADPIGKLQETWGKVVAWFRENIFNPIERWWKDTWLNKNIVEPLIALFAPMWERVKEIAAGAWEFIKFLALGAWDIITSIWKGLAPLFQAWWDTVVQIVKERIIFVIEIVQSLKTIFEGIITFLRGVFTQNWREAWTGIAMIFDGIFGGIKAMIKLTVNSIIDVINGFLRAVVLGVNAVAEALSNIQITIPDWVPEIGGGTLGFNIAPVTAPQIPRLATGAVIPPNAQFAAILGDNKKENEILAPESTIRRIIQEELGGAGGNDMMENVITLEGEVIYRATKRVERRRGKSLIVGGSLP